MPKIPEGAKKPTDRLAAEANATDDVTIDLNGTPIRVLSPLDWDKNAASCLNTLNFEGWAAGAVHPDDVDKFNTTRASLRQTLEAIKSIESMASVDVGEFLAS